MFIRAAVSDKNSRNVIITAVGSIMVGIFLFILMPFIILLSTESIKPPETDIRFDENAFMSQLSSGQQEQIAAFEAAGQKIAEAMAGTGLHEKTIEAQLIYMSYFDGSDIDFVAYAAHFNQDNEPLIQSINDDYGLAIDYTEFMRTYTIVINSTINEYMFTNKEEKNAADLASWCRNAYESRWRYADYSIGERTGDDRIRCADNVGLIMGYVRYDTEKKCFTDDTVNMYYTIRGDIDTIPDIQGIGVFNGSEFGVYVGGGEVVFSSAIGGIQRQALAESNWTEWCTFEAVSYPQNIINGE